MRDMIRMVSVLFIACGLAAGSLAVVNALTREPIAAHDKQRDEAALKRLFPDAEQFREVPPAAESKSASAEKAWEACDTAGQTVGRVFRTEARGYGGPVLLMLGVDSTGAITGLQVLNHTETPGLGAKVAGAPFRDQFKGKRAEQLILRKSDPVRGKIDAVTGATISSRAVMNAVKSRIESANRENAGGAK